MVSCAGCASKLSQGSLREILGRLPSAIHPEVLIGFDTSDDAGVFQLSEDLALVQTIDFFTPIVDDPYAYGAIAAANALSDIYAMGGRPITALNVACFNPDAAPPEVWAAVLRGAFDKTTEAGAAILGGHSVEDKEPKFGMAVTGLVDPRSMFANTGAEPGDSIYFSKKLGTGIVATAAKYDQCPPEVLDAAIAQMATLNRDAAEAGRSAGVRCATDVTGFGLTGHLFNVARASGVRIEIEMDAVPILDGVEPLIAGGNVTTGGGRNAAFIGERASYVDSIPEWKRIATTDPQTSGGLALFSKRPIPGMARIGKVVSGGPAIHFF